AVGLFVLSSGCAKNESETKQGEISLGTVRSALGTGPNCTGSGDPMTGATGSSTCTGILGQSTFQQAVCACNSLNASARFITDGFDSAQGPPNGGLGGGVATNGSENWSAQVTIGGDLLTPSNVSASLSSEV